MVLLLLGLLILGMILGMVAAAWAMHSPAKVERRRDAAHARRSKNEGARRPR
jgi:hypothetical protein